MKKVKEWFKYNWLYVLIGMLAVLTILFIIFEIWVFVTYKDTPIKDIPYWVLWFLPGKN